jgi:hypothetical protein
VAGREYWNPANCSACARIAPKCKLFAYGDWRIDLTKEDGKTASYATKHKNRPIIFSSNAGLPFEYG